MEISVVLAYYDKLSNLELLLAAFNDQTFTDFEVIIAEDDNNSSTETFLRTNKDLYSYPITHLNQEEKRGFRKNKMLNKAVRISRGRTLVFIDGDCIPHKKFLKEYDKNSKNGLFFSGRRVLLGKKISKKILMKKSSSYLRYFSMLFSDSRLKKEGIYWPYFGLHIKKGKRKLSGCNWGIRKEDLLKVNGFDEDYVRPGVGEDFDIEWRLKKIGLKKKSMKNKAIVYHIYHPRIFSEIDVRHNYSLLEQKKLANQIKCFNGLEK